MLDRLPDRIDPIRLARAGASLKGWLPLQAMQRLGESLNRREGVVEAELTMGRDPAGVVYVRGVARAQLELICQRCLEPMLVPVEAHFNLAAVEGEAQAEQLSDEYEPLMLGDEPLSLSAILEDELILALPVVALHALEECPARDRMQAGAAAGQDEAEAKRNPFAVLNELKTKR